jgi:hypothetical protein
MFGERQLHQNSVNVGVGVEAAHQRQQFFLTGRGREIVLFRSKTALNRRLAFGPHVDLAGGVLADENDGKTRSDAARDQTPRRLGDCREQASRDRLAVDDERAARRSFEDCGGALVREIDFLAPDFGFKFLKAASPRPERRFDDFIVLISTMLD